MKILDIAEFYSETGGGVTTLVNQKLDAAVRHGHEVVVVAPGMEDRVDERAGGKIIWVKSPPLPVDPQYYRMFGGMGPVHEILDRETPDIIEGSSPWRGAWIAARWRGTAPRVLVLHQDFVAAYGYTYLGRLLKNRSIDRLFGWYWSYLRRLTARFDSVVVSGDWLAERLALFGIARVAPIPFGVKKDGLTPQLRDDKVRRELLAACGVEEDGKLLLTVGRFHPEKRVGTIIGGFERAKKGQPMGLVIVGDGGSRRRIERRAHRAGNVHLAGAIRDRGRLAKYLASADLLLHGCAHETFGLVVAEAMCAGLPLVVPRTGGAGQLASREFAEMYDAGDPDACAAAILRLVARNRQSLSLAAFRAASERVPSINDHFKNLFAFYETLTQRRGPSAPGPHAFNDAATRVL